MRCRAWETNHENGLKYVHVVEESLEVEVVKDLAERLADSPCKMPILRDIAGSYLRADKGHESIGFSAFTELDRSIIDEVESVKGLLQQLVRSNQVYAKVLSMISQRLKLKEDNNDR